MKTKGNYNFQALVIPVAPISSIPRGNLSPEESRLDSRKERRSSKHRESTSNLTRKQRATKRELHVLSR